MIEDYESVKKWLNSKPYSEETKISYIRTMEKFCEILEMNPDSIVSQIKNAPNPKDVINDMKLKIATYLHDVAHLMERSIHFRLHAFHTFLRANNIAITSIDMWEFLSKGPAWLKRERKMKVE